MPSRAKTCLVEPSQVGTLIFTPFMRYFVSALSKTPRKQDQQQPARFAWAYQSLTVYNFWLVSRT